MPEISVPAGSLAQVLKAAGLTPSTSEALRMIDGGGVRINGEKVGDRATALAAGELRRAAGGQAKVCPRHADLTQRTKNFRSSC
jgi:tyrosyl-tRNA synthetase